MNKQKIVSILAIVLLSLTYAFSLLPQTQATVSTVDTSPTNDAVRFSNQRKTFHANGRFWVFYSNGLNITYKTSLNGESWTNATVLNVPSVSGMFFNIWFNGTYMHYVYGDGDISGKALFYRRGTPNADGSITWSADEQTAVAASTGLTSYPYVSVDSDGYPWLIYTQNGVATNVSKSSTNNGTWVTASGFPYKLYTSWSYGSVIPLTSGKMLAVWGKSGACYLRAWNGSAWLTDVDIGYGVLVKDGYRYSAVAVDNDVHIALLNATSPYNIEHFTYTYSTNSIGNFSIVQAATSSTSGPALTLSSNHLYCFWMGSPTAKHIYYKNLTSGVWSANPTDWIDESTDDFYTNGELTSFYQSFGNYVALEYLTKPSDPHNVKLGFFSDAPVTVTITSPTNTTYTSSSISVNLSASGGTIDQIWFSLKRGTEIIFLNTTYTVPTTMTLGNGSYTFDAYANNTDGNSDKKTVMFTVTISTPAPEEEVSYGFDWPDWSVYLPNFSLNLYMTLMLLGALPLIVAMMYVVSLFVRGTFPPVRQLVEVVGVLAMVSFLTVALIPVITAILEGYGFP